MAARAPKGAGAVRPEWDIFKRAAPGLVLGFHGCDRKIGERVIRGEVSHLTVSRNDYDWLGDGIYFWEWDPWRALAFATEASQNKHLTRGKIKDPYVVGAIIDLGLCLNLMEIDKIAEVREAYAYLETVADIIDGVSLPENKGAEMGRRYLDRAVIEVVHSLRTKRRLDPYSSAKAAFIEGEALYDGAGFRSKNHVQLAVRDHKCIKGYFRLPGI